MNDGVRQCVIDRHLPCGTMVLINWMLKRGGVAAKVRLAQFEGEELDSSVLTLYG